MKDIHLKEKEEVTTVRRSAPSFSIALIIIGAILLALGVIAYNTTDMTKYYHDKDINESLDASNIKNIRVESGLIDLDIKKSSTDKIEVRCTNVPESFDVRADGDTLRISYVNRSFWDSGYVLWFGPGMSFGRQATAEIYLPEKEYENILCSTGTGDVGLYDLACTKFELDTGTGNSTVSNVVCKYADLDTGTGNLNIDGFDCEGLCNVDTGVGNSRIKNAEVGELDCDVGVGNMNFYGTVNGDIRLDCGIGNTNVYLTNPASDFNGGKYQLDIESGIGNVKVTYDN